MKIVRDFRFEVTKPYEPYVETTSSSPVHVFVHSTSGYVVLVTTHEMCKTVDESTIVQSTRAKRAKVVQNRKILDL